MQALRSTKFHFVSSILYFTISNKQYAFSDRVVSSWSIFKRSYSYQAFNHECIVIFGLAVSKGIIFSTFSAWSDFYFPLSPNRMLRIVWWLFTYVPIWDDYALCSNEHNPSLRIINLRIQLSIHLHCRWDGICLPDTFCLITSLLHKIWKSCPAVLLCN